MGKLLSVLLLVVVALRAFSLYDQTRLVARPDYDLGVVFLERWRGEYLLGVESVIPIEEYLDHQLKGSIVEKWRSENRRARESQELAFDAKGLIPDIELPKLPVFGEGSKIDISGQDRITLGGRQQVIEGYSTRTDQGSRLLPELKMEQQLAVRLNGQIGERTKVDIDHDSERQDAKNKIKLSYEGTEDEIVQSVELGDTRLSIPGTGYTGDLPAHSGLFGASAKGKLGPVDIYGVASREESQSQTQTFRGQRRVSVYEVWGWQYETRRFYYPVVPESVDVRSLRVYRDDKVNTNNEAAVEAIATVYPDYPDSIPTNFSNDRMGGDFDLLRENIDYVFNTTDWTIEFERELSQLDVVGLVVVTDSDTLGGHQHNDSLVLVMLKTQDTDENSLTWDYEARNIYSLPKSEVDMTSLRIFRNDKKGFVEYESEGSNSTFKFTYILGLDPNGDDVVESPLFDRARGLIRFPGAKPFASLELSVRDSVIYSKPRLSTGQGEKYKLVAEYSSVTESYYLGQTDIEGESEKVRVDGELWVRDDDYDIDYLSGLLTFRRLVPPDADIQVTYEYRPWFSMSQKSLLGTRAEWKFTESGRVGSSVFYRSEGMPDDRPVLGSEPFQRMIAEADASYSASSEEVSAFLDRLPLLRAQAPSRVSASMEGAVSLPDPNTRGVAYLDDFESTTITREATPNEILWYHGSVPENKDTADFAQTPLYWSNPTDKVRRDSVFGPTAGEEGNETDDFLRVVFTPDPGNPETWAGMTWSPGRLAWDLEEIENLEIVMRSRRRRGSLHITAGVSIDEDAPRRNRAGAIVGYNGRYDTEDADGNGKLNEAFEDTGLDAVYGADDEWAAGSPDDGNDDYDPDANPTGKEGNKRLDSEDIDGTGFSRYNHYYECVIPIGEGDYLERQLYNGWERYRVSLKDTNAFTAVGQPKWDNIRLIRVWFDGFDETDTIEFYSLGFVGSRWRLPSIRSIENRNMEPVDTTEKVWVSQVTTRTDEGYVPPYEPKRDALGNEEKESSLLFVYQNLYGNREAVVHKTGAVADDYRDYSGLRVYVHRDSNELDWFLRLGADSTNYYEYGSALTAGNLVPGRDGKWHEFDIDLDSFPGLKARRDSFGSRDSSWRSGSYAVLGFPSLGEIRYSALGIRNRGDKLVSGGVWFDDLRLSEPRKEQGYGFQASAEAALSDFVSASASFGYSDPNFRRFRDVRKVKTGGFGTNLGYSVRAGLDRLLPYSWGLNVPVSYIANRQGELPKFSSVYRDLRLDSETAEHERGSGYSEDLALDNLSKRQSENRLLNYTLEAMSLSWRWHRAGRHAALARDSSTSTGLQWGYSVSPDIKVRLSEDDDLYLFPQGVRFDVGHGERRDNRVTITTEGDTLEDSQMGSALSADLGVEYSPIEDLNFDYGISSDRDLAVPNPDTVLFLALGSEEGRDENFSVGYSMDIGDFLSPSADFDADYTENRTKGEGNEYTEHRNITNSGDVDLGLGLDVPELLGRFETEPTRTGDSGQARTPTLGRLAGALSRSLDPVDFGYTISRSSGMMQVYYGVPWHYRFGFTGPPDTLWGSASPDSQPTSISQEDGNSFRVSSGARVKDISGRVSYDWSEGRNRQYRAVSLDRSTTWPDLEVSVGKVHTLFRSAATSSNLTARYRRRVDLDGTVEGGELRRIGQTVRKSDNFDPLVSWQTTWKKRISSTVSANYTFTDATVYLGDTEGDRSVASTIGRGANISLTYAFSAPGGLRLPFLRRIRFSSDLRLTWSVKLSESKETAAAWSNDVLLETTENRDDGSWSTDLAASYSFSSTVEAGLNFGYGNGTDRVGGNTTRTTNLDIWVLFKF